MKIYVHYAVYIETTSNIGIISISIWFEVYLSDDVLLLKRWENETAPLNSFDRQPNAWLRVFIGLHSRTNSTYAIHDCASASALICTHNGWARILFVFYLCDDCKSIALSYTHSIRALHFHWCTAHEPSLYTIDTWLLLFVTCFFSFEIVHRSFYKGDSVKSA